MVAKQHSCTLGTLASKVPLGVHGIVVVVFMPTHKLIVPCRTFVVYVACTWSTVACLPSCFALRKTSSQGGTIQSYTR